MGLRKGQKELVCSYRGGRCALPAIPGGGKTYCLAVWAARMIEQNLHLPGKILIVTYMNSAVNNFIGRISSELEKLGLDPEKGYHVCTIHSLCLDIISEKPDKVMISDELRVADEYEQKDIFSQALDIWLNGNEKVFKFFLDETKIYNKEKEQINKILERWKACFSDAVMSGISRCKHKNITSAMLKSMITNSNQTSLLKCMAEIYEIYERYLNIRGVIDFDDMLSKALVLLRSDEKLLEKYRTKYTYVCEDEAQDSNEVQSKILELIGHRNLLRVGDSNQAICGTFTSSDFRLFKDFCEEPGIAKYYITQSSRSTKEIIDLANFFVTYVTEQHPVLLCRNSMVKQYIETVDEEDEFSNPKTDKYGIKFNYYQSWNNEVQNIAKLCSAACKKSPDSTLAVLAPTGRRIEDIADKLRKYEVDFEMLDGFGGIYSAALKLGLALKMLSNPFNNTIVEEFTARCFPQELDIEYRKKMTQRIIDMPCESMEKVLINIAHILNFDQEEMAFAHKAASDVWYRQIWEANYSIGDLADELLGNNKSRKGFKYFSQKIKELHGYEPKPGIVTLATYHKAKGLEWDVVFLTGLNNSDFPAYLNDKFVGDQWYLKQDYSNPEAVLKAELEQLVRSNNQFGICPRGSNNPDGNDHLLINDPISASKIEIISERARLLYVGITRAKKYLFISGSTDNTGKFNEVRLSAYFKPLYKFSKERSEIFEHGQ